MDVLVALVDCDALQWGKRQTRQSNETNGEGENPQPNLTFTAFIEQIIVFFNAFGGVAWADSPFIQLFRETAIRHLREELHILTNEFDNWVSHTTHRSICCSAIRLVALYSLVFCCVCVS